MKFFLLVMLLAAIPAMAQKPAYRMVNPAGNDVPWDTLVAQLSKADIVFIGEYHNNPICHWMEYEITAALIEKKQGKIVLGAEMFETDDQLILNEYLQGKIKFKNFREEAKLWNNYKTDYEPLVELAKEKGLAFIATNIPRRYAAMVAASGFAALDSVSAEALKLMAPLPMAYDEKLNCYQSMLSMQGMGGASGHANANLPKAQAVKDATMAHFILQNMKAGYTFVHYNGSFHSDNHEGIVWYVKKQKPSLKIVVISVSELDDLSKPAKEDLGSGEYTLLVPSTMTKTY